MDTSQIREEAVASLSAWPKVAASSSLVADDGRFTELDETGEELDVVMVG
ncbi:hypothetical protein BJ085DRAFT_36068 [Dimargaris cristalligena]|uniref:Uncharacterized protein n=1 Tax=Dimargaris cristalligena TaxID=215637 RepID=A0A4P9ZMX5_9FUNG|nr:hypothetical protein BJ085DRAFT_36068 [Dimargaris cristalligena]|eukprot:RKP33882.1 hypothetical protein BJ085DRAFT_36068 [Dimargaris cristalligena]